MRIFYFLPLLFILTACPFSSDDEEVIPQVDPRPVRSVAGADTSTIKISETESFNLNNFLVCFEQIAIVYKDNKKFNHFFSGDRLDYSIRSHKFLGNFNYQEKRYDFNYDNGVIKSYSRSVGSDVIFEYDSKGMIVKINYDVNGELREDSFEYDKYKNLIKANYKNHSIERNYDNENRMISYVYPDYNSVIYIDYLEDKPVFFYREDSSQHIMWETTLKYEQNRVTEEYREVFNEYNNKDLHRLEYKADTIVSIQFVFNLNDEPREISRYYYNSSFELIKEKKLGYNFSYPDSTYQLVNNYLDNSGDNIFKIDIYNTMNDNIEYLGYASPNTYVEGSPELIETGTIYNKFGQPQYLIDYSNYQPGWSGIVLKNNEGEILAFDNEPYWVRIISRELRSMAPRQFYLLVD
ncbi:hypothetical protein OO013_06465 [Mangrovivirga sp. M17]|uniref:YD repeat-containing protein n=1 Tax=Mangrovivirga halotolerans TaxID=2993936 RepID=A0ABT3RQP9_9BACT|nr:hypothetical protein [Mangrovivirga halotolerans]MCX2743500.1 hypothetical protein [Mangrovivirga halotolerans]